MIHSDQFHPSELIGSWSLQRWEMQLDGVVHLPYSDRAAGLLIYTQSGQMSAFLHHPEWCKLDSVNTDHLMLFGAYAGHWSVKQNTVHHHVEFASAPSLIGTTLVRVVKKLAASHLVLESEPLPTAPRHVLEWRRL